jgi:hypothetical protein
LEQKVAKIAKGTGLGFGTCFGSFDEIAFARGRSGSQTQTKRFGTEGSKGTDWGLGPASGSFDEIAFARGTLRLTDAKQRGLEQKVAGVTKGLGFGDSQRGILHKAARQMNV